MYVDAAYRYRPSSVVCRSVGLSVCHTSELCKNGCSDRDAVWVETLVGPGNHVLNGGPDPPWEGAFFGGEHPIVKYRDSTVICAKTAELIEMPFGLWACMGPRNHVLDGGPYVLRDTAIGTNFWLSMGYNFGCMIADDTLFDSRGGFSGSSCPMKT